MARLHDYYKASVMPQLQAKFGYTSVMEIPRITKITLNMGVGEAVGDKKILENAVADMVKISGQKPVVTKARKAIAGFKIRARWRWRWCRTGWTEPIRPASGRACSTS